MRHCFLLLIVFCLTVNAYDYYCNSGDTCSSCGSQCEYYCGGLEKSSYECYYEYDSSLNQQVVEGVYCYCDMGGWGWTLIIVAPTLVLCWICFAIVIGSFLCQKRIYESFEKESILATDENSYVLYTATPPFCTRLLGGFIASITCGLLLPFIMVRLIKMYFDKFWFAGSRGEFHGQPIDYCVSVCCVNQILSCFTCGFWRCCGYAWDREHKWIDDHVTVEGQQNSDVFLFQARPAWYKIILTGILSCLTCGLAAPIFFAAHMKETIAQMMFDNKKANFIGTTDDYISEVWLPTCGFNIITCGFYRCCGLADLRWRTWVDRHVRSGVDPEFAQNNNTNGNYSNSSFDNNNNNNYNNNNNNNYNNNNNNYNNNGSGKSLVDEDFNPPPYGNNMYVHQPQQPAYNYS